MAMQTFRSESGLLSIMNDEGSVTIHDGEETVGSFKAVPFIWWAGRVQRDEGGKRISSFMGEDFGWVSIDHIGGIEAAGKELKAQKPVEESPSILPEEAFQMGFEDGQIGREHLLHDEDLRVAYRQGWATGSEQRGLS
tara:strand:- start:1400 stop:1813 length:414 start_codon:yes stop_codon:yes gene_type:complete